MNEQEVFEQAFARILVLEGGDSNHPNDKGGKTRFGISSSSNPNVDIDNLTIHDAKEIYYNEYWSRYGLYKLASKPRVAVKVMEMSVVAGPRRGIMLLQRALRSCSGKKLAEDGILGTETENAFFSANEECLLVGLRSEMAGYFRTIVEMNKDQQVFREGWLSRAYS